MVGWVEWDKVIMRKWFELQGLGESGYVIKRMRRHWKGKMVVSKWGRQGHNILLARQHWFLTLKPLMIDT